MVKENGSGVELACIIVFNLFLYFTVHVHSSPWLTSFPHVRTANGALHIKCLLAFARRACEEM